MNNDDAPPHTDDNAICTAEELIAQLKDMPPHAPVLLSVVKYPREFSLKTDASTAGMRWDSGTDTEQQPLHPDDIHLIDGLVCLVVELNEYDPDRGGS